MKLAVEWNNVFHRYQDLFNFLAASMTRGARNDIATDSTKFQDLCLVVEQNTRASNITVNKLNSFCRWRRR